MASREWPQLWRMVGDTLMGWMEAGLRELRHNQTQIDRLNVFPVADGDTGRNMVHTVEESLIAMRRSQEGSLDAIWQSVAEGAVMGARGNSGVILSQILAGFAESAEGKAVFEAHDLKAGFIRAAHRARKQVSHPVEGTILTVADAMGWYCRDDEDLVQCLATAVEAGEEALAKTSEQLAALAANHVVDAGALGYLTMVRGWLRAARGEHQAGLAEPEHLRPVAASTHAAVEQKAFLNDAIPYYYDVEALLHRLRCLNPEAVLAEKLAEIGDSIVLAPGAGIIKVHVHTANPVALMEILVSVGDIRQMEWLDMRQQVADRLAEEQLTVVADEAMHPLFADMYRVVTSELAQDAADTLWIGPTQPLNLALGVASAGLAGQVALDYLPGESWEQNRSRLADRLSTMRHWIVERIAEGFKVGDAFYESREALRDALVQEMDNLGMVTVYLSQNARQEEAVHWQDAFNAALVQMPGRSPWMEIVWQP